MRDASCRRLRWLKWVLIAFLLIDPAIHITFFYYMFASFGLMLPDVLRISSYSFTTFVVIAEYVSILLLILVPINCLNIAFEMREHGVLLGMGRLKFVPWSGITECRWFVARTKVARWLRWGVPKPYKRSRFTIAERRIATEQKDGVTAVLARFAPVYDHDGALLARPSEADVAARAARPVQDRSRFMFQFDLQSLMLLVVVVSCVASCYGIHLRRLEPQIEAIAHLRAFQPSVDDFDGVPWRLDFSKCAVKPTDSDLAYLEPLSELSMLDLSGSPITDAGLAHLMGLKRLDSITLKDTAVTSKGAAELSRASRRLYLLRPRQSPGVVRSCQAPRRGDARQREVAGGALQFRHAVGFGSHGGGGRGPALRRHCSPSPSIDKQADGAGGKEGKGRGLRHGGGQIGP